jgi:hypothetical protein
MAVKRRTPECDSYTKGLAERLAIARKLVEPRQVDAARQCDIDYRTWYRYEAATRILEPSVLARFCIEYDIDPRWLILGDPSGLRWPLAANMRYLPEAVKYLPEPPPSLAADGSPGNTPAAAVKVDRRKQLAPVR